MQLRGLVLTDFRNYAEASVEFSPGLNLVVGRNGQGKTNLLEAINVLSGLGSHRGAAGEAMVRQGAERAVLSGTGSAGGRDVRVDAEVKRTGGTRLLVNRVAVERMHASSSAGMLVAVAFSPDDLVIIKGAPEERRRLLDQGATRVRPLGGAERQEFDRVLRQRTGLLKAAPTSQRALATLDVWDESFARAGAVVVRNRLAVLDRLRPEVLRRYRSVSGEDGEVSVEYKASWLEPGRTDARIRSDLATLLRNVAKTDLVDVSTRLERFTKPVTIVWGQRDRAFKPALGRRLAALFPNCTLIEVPDARTFVSLDRPDAVIDAVAAVGVSRPA